MKKNSIVVTWLDLEEIIMTKTMKMRILIVLIIALSMILEKIFQMHFITISTLLLDLIFVKWYEKILYATL